VKEQGNEMEEKQENLSPKF